MYKKPLRGGGFNNVTLSINIVPWLKIKWVTSMIWWIPEQCILWDIHCHHVTNKTTAASSLFLYTLMQLRKYVNVSMLTSVTKKSTRLSLLSIMCKEICPWWGLMYALTHVSANPQYLLTQPVMESYIWLLKYIPPFPTHFKMLSSNWLLLPQSASFNGHRGTHSLQEWVSQGATEWIIEGVREPLSKEEEEVHLVEIC